MVRVVSQSFNHPRSRHSSGETDLDLSLRADSALALSSQRAKRTDLVDYESSSDSFWDSEFDVDQQDQLLCQTGKAEDELNGNEAPEKSDVHSKRKERRRERNKVSAQAYRQRRRQDNVSTQQELTMLEERNKHLLKQVHDLEEKREQAKQFLKGQSVAVPDFLIANKTNLNNGHFYQTNSSNFSCDLRATSTTPISDESLSSPLPSLAVNANVNVNLNSQPMVFGSFTQNDCQVANGNSPNFNANANLPKISSINLNALSAPPSPVSDAFLSSPSMSPVAGSVPVVKPKQNFLNANHYYRVPIHHPKVLRTVHEIPPNFNNEEESSPLTVDNKPRIICDSSELKSEGAKAICDDLGTNAHTALLNMNERVNSNIRNKDDKIWNGAYHMNPLKTVNMNDNDNASLSKPHLQNTPQQLLLPPNSFVQLIITSGENKLPSQ